MKITDVQLRFAKLYLFVQVYTDAGIVDAEHEIHHAVAQKHLADGDRGLRSGAAGGAGNADQRGIERTAVFHPGGNREDRDRRDPPGYYSGLV